MSHGNYKFGTTLNCMDGRAVESTIAWMKEVYNVDYIDAITEPGMDVLLLNMDAVQYAHVKRKLEISIKGHGSRIVTVAGHDECAGNPVEHDTHKTNVIDSVEIVKKIIAEIDPTLHIAVQGIILSRNKDDLRWKVEKL